MGILVIAIYHIGCCSVVLLLLLSLFLLAASGDYWTDGWGRWGRRRGRPLNGSTFPRSG